jgi:hypothetical protein
MKNCLKTELIPNSRLLWRMELALDFCAASLLVWLLAGCSTTKPFEVAEVVGPRPLSSYANKPNEGALVVYSGLDGFNVLDPEHDYHTPYTIASETGNSLQTISNRTGSFGEDPVTVALPAGAYKIKAKAQNFGGVIVPVMIRPGQTTVVHLDGSVDPAGGEGLVRLPNGQVAGWKAQ